MKDRVCTIKPSDRKCLVSFAQKLSMEVPEKSQSVNFVILKHVLLVAKHLFSTKRHQNAWPRIATKNGRVVT
jgi:hypothetical protein